MQNIVLKDPNWHDCNLNIRLSSSIDRTELNSYFNKRTNKFFVSCDYTIKSIVTYFCGNEWTISCFFTYEPIYGLNGNSIDIYNDTDLNTILDYYEVRITGKIKGRLKLWRNKWRCYQITNTKTNDTNILWVNPGGLLKGGEWIVTKQSNI
jgi:hypothetical protein